MERYCIAEGKVEDDKSFSPKFRSHRFTVLKFAEEYVPYKCPEDKWIAKKRLPIFPECVAEIHKLFSDFYEEEAETKEIMYCDILDDSCSSKTVTLDVCLHVYYSLLYEQNKDCYVSLTEKNWTSDEKSIMRQKRKDCNRYLRNHPDKVRPFVIKEKKKDEVKEECNEETKIQKFAFNISRLYYQSSEFRQIFTEVEKEDAKKFSYSNMKALFALDSIRINRKEEIWLSEYLLGINLAMMFYSFFNPILKDINFETIKQDYIEILYKTIRKVMQSNGIYTRCLMVQKLKIIYEVELKLGDNDITCEERLNYLYDEILSKRMPVYIEYIKWVEKSVLDYYRNSRYAGNNPLKEIGKACDTLIKEQLVCSDGYFLLKDYLPKSVDDDKLYKLIQKIILSERKEWVSSS